MIGVNGHKIMNAYRFVSNVTSWAVIGGTDPWPDENNPPQPELTATTVNTIIGAKKASSELIYQDDVNGTEVFQTASGTTTKWVIVPDLAGALANNAHHVLIKATIVGTELPLTDFREVGVYTNLQPEALVPPGQENLLPSEIADYGAFELLEYRKVVTRDSSSAYEIVAILEF